MAKSALPLLAVGAGALLLMSGKKKKKTSSSVSQTIDVPPTQPPPVQTGGSSGGSAGVAVWKQRQTALAFVAGMGVCNCHPGAIDGLYGPATINAVIAFQVCTDIQVDGKWGPQTDAMMKRILAQIAEGQVYIKTTSKKASSEKTSSKFTPKIIIRNDVVVTTSGHKYNLNAFSVPNFTFRDNQLDSFGPAGAGIGILNQFDASNGKEGVVYITTSWAGDTVAVIEVARRLALDNHNLFFMAGRGPGLNIISVFEPEYLSYDAWKRRPIAPSKVFLTRKETGMSELEYKKKIEKVLRSDLADLMSKAGWV